MNAPRMRSLLVWAAVTVATPLVVSWALPSPSTRPDDFETLLVAGAGLVLAGCTVWWWVVTTVVVASTLVGWERSCPGVPEWARHAIVLACGLGVVATGPAAMAAPGHGPEPNAVVVRTDTRVEARAHSAADSTADSPASPSQSLRPDLSGLPLPDRTFGGLREDASTDLDRDDHAVRGSGAVHVVSAGESLWSIAVALSPDASPAALADDVAALYHANRAVIGPDPDLISPGLRLDLSPLTPLRRTAR